MAIPNQDIPTTPTAIDNTEVFTQLANCALDGDQPSVELMASLICTLQSTAGKTPCHSVVNAGIDHTLRAANDSLISPFGKLN